MGVYNKQRKDGSDAWYYDFMVNNVRYRGVGGTTKTQAIRAQEKVRDMVLSGEYNLIVKSKNITLNQFSKIFLQRRRHMRSWLRDDLSVRTLLQVFNSKNLSGISLSDIEEYILKRKNDGVANGTVNRELTCLKRMFNLAIKWGYTRKNPVNDITFLQEPPGRTRVLSKDEITKLLEVSSKYLKPLILTALNTGLRLKEILDLTWDRVHLLYVIDPYIEIEITKNNRKRFLPLNDVMIELLTDLYNSKQDSEFVFLNSLGTKYHHITQVFQNTLSKVKITNFRFHDLRHTFASHFIMSGGDLLTLKELLGHSSLKMVERYAHLAASHKRKQLNNMTAIFADCHPIATSEPISKSG